MTTALECDLPHLEGSAAETTSEEEAVGVQIVTTGVDQDRPLTGMGSTGSVARGSQIRMMKQTYPLSEGIHETSLTFR